MRAMPTEPAVAHIPRRALALTQELAAVVRAAATAAWPDGNPNPCCRRPRSRTFGRRRPGRWRTTRSLIALARTHAFPPAIVRSEARALRPASLAVAALRGTAPKAPHCMSAAKGSVTLGGSVFTNLNNEISRRLTRGEDARIPDNTVVTVAIMRLVSSCVTF